MNPTKKFKTLLKPRSKTSHKGDFGKIFILAGSKGLSGACVLTSTAALRSGAGLVTVGVPNSLVLPLAKRMTEAMTKGFPETKVGTLSKQAIKPVQKFLKTQDVLAAGPGLSTYPETQKVIQSTVLNSSIPIVLDADGLNAFQNKTHLLKKLKAPAILTPHPGEFARLFGGKIPFSEKERQKRAGVVAQKFNVVLVLKGHHTIVASPKGETYMNLTGNPGMATAGAGDVLTGIIAAFLGQRIQPFYAACFAVLIHGLAGDLAKKEVGEISLIASDIIRFLPKAFKNILKY